MNLYTTINPYKQRDVTLHKLGYSSYTDYLNSKLWKRLKRKQLKKNGHKCIKCSSFTNIIHHLNYEYDTLIGRNPFGLIPVCYQCHTAAETYENGNKTNLYEANDYLGYKYVYCPTCEQFQLGIDFIDTSRDVFINCSTCRNLSNSGVYEIDLAYRKLRIHK